MALAVTFRRRTFDWRSWRRSDKFETALHIFAQVMRTTIRASFNSCVTSIAAFWTFCTSYNNAQPILPPTIDPVTEHVLSHDPFPRTETSKNKWVRVGHAHPGMVLSVTVEVLRRPWAAVCPSVDGAHRVAAARLAGFTHVPAEVRPLRTGAKRQSPFAVFGVVELHPCHWRDFEDRSSIVGDVRTTQRHRPVAHRPGKTLTSALLIAIFVCAG